MVCGSSKAIYRIISKIAESDQTNETNKPKSNNEDNQNDSVIGTKKYKDLTDENDLDKTRLYISRITTNTTQKSYREYFEQFGEMTECGFRNNNKGFGIFFQNFPLR